MIQRFRRLPTETWAIAGLLLFSLSYRLITLPVPRDGGDAMRKWMWGRLILKGWSPADALWTNRWDHHAARVAINVPVLITQTLFGTHPNLYYVPPLLAHLAGVVLMLKVGKHVCGLAAAFWAAALWTFLISVEWSSQLMPEPFSAMYLLACIYCLIRLAQAKTHGWWWLTLAALAMLLAYLSKLPNLFFMPGILFAIWYTTRRWDWVLAFGAMVGVALAVETVLYRELLDYPMGRISVIKGGHLKSHKMKEPIETLWGFFARYRPVFDDVLGPIIALFIPAAILGLGFFRRLSGALQIVLLCCVSFLVCQTFAVQSIDPLLPVQPARSRYLAVLMSPMMIVLAAGISRWVSVELPGWLTARRKLG